VNNTKSNKPSPSNRVAIRKRPYYGAVKKRTRIYTTTTKLTTTSNYNILIVDDNPINLNILTKCLQLLLADHIDRLELASDGVKALEKLNARPFDLVLLDIDMPVLNGLETTRHIRHSSEEYSVLLQNRNIPIVAVTTNDSEDSKNTYFQIGMVTELFIY
jgi:CheY-like chemotaxis protein